MENMMGGCSRSLVLRSLSRSVSLLLFSSSPQDTHPAVKLFHIAVSLGGVDTPQEIHIEETFFPAPGPDVILPEDVGAIIAYPHHLLVEIAIAHYPGAFGVQIVEIPGRSTGDQK